MGYGQGRAGRAETDRDPAQNSRENQLRRTRSQPISCQQRRLVAGKQASPAEPSCSAYTFKIECSMLGIMLMLLQTRRPANCGKQKRAQRRPLSWARSQRQNISTRTNDRCCVVLGFIHSFSKSRLKKSDFHYFNVVGFVAWAMVSGRWSVASGQWSMVTGQWSLVLWFHAALLDNNSHGSRAKQFTRSCVYAMLLDA